MNQKTECAVALAAIVAAILSAEAPLSVALDTCDFLAGKGIMPPDASALFASPSPEDLAQGVSNALAARGITPAHVEPEPVLPGTEDPTAEPVHFSGSDTAEEPVFTG